MQSIFITGASGCLGHYVVERLWQADQQRLALPFELGFPPVPPDPSIPSSQRILPPYHLYLLVRDPQKLQLRFLPTEETSPSGSKITIIQGDLRSIQDHARLLSEMDAVIHLAAAWGGEEAAFEINVKQTLELFRLLDPERCRRILYTSTASLLDRNNQPLPVAGRAGIGYIRSKYELLMRRSEIKLRDRLVTLYPTLLFGGSPQHPYSHITAGLKDVTRWLGLVRFIQADASFHFIHAEDIAQIMTHLLIHPTSASDLVLGNPALTFDQCIEQMCHYFKKRIYFQIPLPIKFLRRLSFLWRIQLSEWDNYCLEHRHFTHDAVNVESFGLPSRFFTLDRILATYT